MMVQRKDVIKKVKAWGAKPIKGDYVFLLFDEIQRESRTPSGVIVLGRTVAEDPLWKATVVGVGNKVWDVKIDDRVLIGKYYGTEIKHDDSSTCKLAIVSEDQIDAMIED